MLTSNEVIDYCFKPYFSTSHVPFHKNMILKRFYRGCRQKKNKWWINEYKLHLNFVLLNSSPKLWMSFPLNWIRLKMHSFSAHQSPFQHTHNQQRTQTLFLLSPHRVRMDLLRTYTCRNFLRKAHDTWQLVQNLLFSIYSLIPQTSVHLPVCMWNAYLANCSSSRLHACHIGIAEEGAG